MKKLLSKLILLFSSTILLCSCQKTKSDYRNYLSGHYVLTNAASIKNGAGIDTPYFANVKKIKKYNDVFKLKESFIDLKIKMVDGKAVGYGNYSIQAAGDQFETLTGDFEYYCYFTDTYGNKLKMTDETKPAYFGRQYYFRDNWWVRTEVFIPEITEDTILLEFTVREKFPVPEEFTHNIY